ncbi:glycosyltransferase family 2 protein [Aquimarina sediminis]|uniref:glycosyltransferase family 2 protein n=1 Tax=Aquimarina sediminis TaxID=2070536 RepID=UPI000CA055DB|nr:glycosyltransferase family 2 protein [Aquimarina sediminis]
MNDISVILINYNSSSYTISCVQSILKQTTSSIKYEIIIVDNASEIEDFETLKNELSKSNIPNLKLVRSKYNTGFGGGNMYGVQFANGKYFAFVNNDTILQNDCLYITFDFLEKTPSAAVCSPQQYDENGNVQKSFDHFLSLKREIFGRKILEKFNPIKFPKRKMVYSSPIQVQSVPGSFLVVKADNFENVGGFDTNIFLYYEETDLCYRIHKNTIGGDCFLIPKGRYTHFNGQSTSKSLAIKKELKISLLYVLRKNSGYIPYQTLRWWLVLKFFFKSIVKPSNFHIFYLFLLGAPINLSLKQKQIIAKQ